MKQIYLDRPTDFLTIGHSVSFDGWSVSPDPNDTVFVRVNGRPIETHEIPRPDVKRAHPTLFAKGFMFFFEPNSNELDYHISIEMPGLAKNIEFRVSDQPLALAEEARATRRKNLTFLMSIIVCPVCRKPPDDPPTIIGNEWHCAQCGEGYDCSSGLNFIRKSYPNRNAISFAGAICSHPYDGDTQHLIKETLAEGGHVLDCGAGWRQTPRANVITTEIVQYPSTDVVAVGEQLPFKDASFDGILSLHVLEHVKNPFVCAAELMRVLKPGGRFLAAIPYIVPVHGYPFHFFNPTPEGLRALFEDFSEKTRVFVPDSAHPVIALRELIKAFPYWFEGPALQNFFNLSIGEFMQLSNSKLKELDLIGGFKAEGQMNLAGNYVITGRRR